MPPFNSSDGDSEPGAIEDDEVYILIDNVSGWHLPSEADDDSSGIVPSSEENQQHTSVPSLVRPRNSTTSYQPSNHVDPPGPNYSDRYSDPDPPGRHAEEDSDNPLHHFPTANRTGTGPSWRRDRYPTGC